MTARYTAEEQTLLAWVQLALPTFTVIYARQPLADAPRPLEPYATLYVSSRRALSSTPHEETVARTPPNNTADDVRSLAYQGVARVDLFHDNAQESLSALTHSIRHEAVRTLFRTNDLYVTGLPTIIPEDMLRAAGYERRAQADYHFRYYDVDTVATDTIGEIVSVITVNPDAIDEAIITTTVDE